MTAEKLIHHLSVSDRASASWLAALVPDAENFGFLDVEERRFNLWLVFPVRGREATTVDVWVQLLKLNTHKTASTLHHMSLCFADGSSKGSPIHILYQSVLSPVSVSCVCPSHLYFALSAASPATPPWPSGKMSLFAVQTQHCLSDGSMCELGTEPKLIHHHRHQMHLQRGSVVRRVNRHLCC